MYLFVPRLLLGVIPTKQIQLALVHWCTIPACVYDVTGLMNIQGGLSRDYIRKCMGRFITQNCSLLILYTTIIYFLALQG